MKQKGAIPIPYIVALIFGVMVIALLGYWFTFQGEKTIIIGEKTECESRKYTFCIQWKNTGFNDDNKPPSLGFDPLTCPMPDSRTVCESTESTSQSQCQYKKQCNVDEKDCGAGAATRKCCKPQCPS